MTKIGSLFTKDDKEKLFCVLNRVRRQAPAAIFLLCVVMLVYVASIYIPPGWFTYFLSTSALGIMAFTALARLDDISPDQSSKRWQLRRAGLVFTIVGVGAIVLEPFASMPSSDLILFPTWNRVIIQWGVAATWITTPNMPPWLRYMTGKASSIDPPEKEPEL